MSKGEELGVLLDEGESIHQQMKSLFAKYNFNDLDLKSLPKADKEEWHRLQKMTGDINSRIAELLNK